MPRPATGNIRVRQTAKNGASYAARFTAYGNREFITLGTEAEGWTMDRAERELTYILARVERGEWTPPKTESPAPPVGALKVVPTFHEFASDWYRLKEPEVRENTAAVYRWELSHHLLPYFADRRLDEITAEDVDRYRAAKIAEGVLSPESVNKTIRRLVAVFDLAIDYEHIQQNPAAGRKRLAKRQSVKQRWLEPDEMQAMVEAAGRVDRAPVAQGLPSRRPLIATLAWAGLRVGELIALRWEDVNMAEGTITVRESKTDAGCRDVDLQPELREELATWAAVTPFGEPRDRVFPSATGKALDRSRIRSRVIHGAAREAGIDTERLSPHAFRRGFASWLIAEGEDPAYVMDQMGHTSERMTMAVYARAVKRNRTSARSVRRAQAVAEATGFRDCLWTNADSAEPAAVTLGR